MASTRVKTTGDARLLARWGDLRHELEWNDPDARPNTVAKLVARLESLGFRAARTRSGAGAFERDGLRVRLAPVEIAGHEGVKLEPTGALHRSALGENLGALYLEDLVCPRSYYQEFEARLRNDLELYRRAPAGPPPRNLLEIKGRINEGRPAAQQAERRARLERLIVRQRELITKVRDMKARGVAPSAILIYTEGPDAAGKTSTGDRLLRPVFEDAGYEYHERAFKAPTPQERQEHWLARFRRNLPADGQVMRWDRGPAGSAAYVTQSPEALHTMTEEFKQLEQELRDRNVLIIPFYLYRDTDRQASTFGGREARARIAREILTSGSVQGEDREELEAVVNGIGLQDLRSSLDFHHVQAGFMNFVEGTGEVVPWAVVNTNRRHLAKGDSLEVVDEALDEFAQMPWGELG